MTQNATREVRLTSVMGGAYFHYLWDFDCEALQKLISVFFKIFGTSDGSVKYS